VTAYKAIKESECKCGDFIVIIGAAGGIGHLAIQYARAMGLRVIAVDVGQERLDYCQSLGAELALDYSQEETVPNMILEFTKGGAHAVINFAAYPAAYDLAIKCARRKGFVVLVAMPAGNTVPLDVTHIILHRITVRGSIIGTREDMREAIEFARRGLVKCNIVIRSLEEINEVIQDVLENRIIGRVVLQFESKE
jgi:propanol-preferring alcohol dehydrogenase